MCSAERSADPLTAAAAAASSALADLSPSPQPQVTQTALLQSYSAGKMLPLLLCLADLEGEVKGNWTGYWLAKPVQLPFTPLHFAQHFLQGMLPIHTTETKHIMYMQFDNDEYNAYGNNDKYTFLM